MNLNVRAAAVLVAACSVAGATACSASGAEKYEEDSLELAEWWYEEEKTHSSKALTEERNLRCRTNILPIRENEYDGNTIADFEELHGALMAAEMEDLGEDEDGDALTFWFEPFNPDPDTEQGSEPWLTLTMKAESGNTFTLTRTGLRESDLFYNIGGEGSKVPLSDISFRHGSSSSKVRFPIPEGFLTSSDPLDHLELELYGKDFAWCEPAEGSSGVPEVTETEEASPTSTPESSRDSAPLSASVSQSICKGISEGRIDAFDLAYREKVAFEDDGNGNRVREMIPRVCPENQAVLDEAVSGHPVQKRSPSGKFLVAERPDENRPKVIQPGMWRTTESPVGDCYWERGDGAGNIIENNFVTFAEAVTVTIAPTDGTFVSQRCGDWERVG